MAASYRYDSFGNLMTKTGTLDQPFGFSTKRYDAGTGLAYYGYRFYNPSIGKWLTRDPIQEAGGINLYGFVLNDPVNWIDPYGLIRWGTVGKGTAKAFFGAVGVAGGAFAASTPTGIGQVAGTAMVLAGSSAIGFGVTQIIAGFTHNEIPFMGSKEAIIQKTTSGLTKKIFLQPMKFWI